jgi:UDP-N-acetylmuramoyl-tripeptide--D-alanyl-D-alanine ligase
MIAKTIKSFLAASARRAIKRDKPLIVAITGSLGKSSAKEAIAAALGAFEPGSDVRASLKNYNNEYGVPFTVLNVSTPGRDPIGWIKILWRALWVGWGFGRIRAKTLVLEMAADRKGDLAWLTGIAAPHVSVMTSIAPAHAEYLGSLEEIASEKATLIRTLGKGGLAVLNADDARVTAMRKETEANAVYVGESEGSDVRIRDVRITSETDERGHVVPRGIEVAVDLGSQAVRFELQGTIGRPQSWAAGFALAVASHLKIPTELAILRLQRDYHGIAGRTRIIPGIKYTTIIDDTYNAASPSAVVSALRDVASIPLDKSVQRRIAAFGDMRELGAYADEAHRTVGHETAAQGFDVLVTCGTLARGIAAAAREAGMPEESIMSFDMTAEAGLYLQKIIREGDMILVKGSQGSRMEKVVKELMAEPLQAPFLLVRMTADWVNRT